jgi:pimeloyl-ACP methyl ester carboxylesterase/enoyl-CoA hydratase/carnithine racemase
MTEGLIVESQWQVLQVGIATADGKNEMTDAMVAGLTSLFREPPEGIAAIVLHAEGYDFCRGRAVAPPPPASEGAEARTRAVTAILGLYDAIEQCALPVTCFVNGLASGLGCAIVAASDYAVAASDSRFDAPELEKQFTPGLLMSALSGRIHAKATARLVLTTRPIDAPTALAVGLISEVVEPGELAGAQKAFTALMNGRSPLALAGIKRFLRESPKLSHEDCSALAAAVTSQTVAARAQAFESSAVPTNVQRMSIGNEEIAFIDEGAGPPLILLHSLGTSSELWRTIVPLLAMRHRVIAIDARGHGSSTNRDGYQPDAVARDVVEVADRLGLERFGLIGISMGGLTAVRVAAKLGHRVAALLLSSAYASVAGDLAEQRIATVERMLERMPMAAFARTYVEQTLARDTLYATREAIARQIAAVDKANYLETLRAICRDDVSSLLEQIDAPCLVLNAENDPSVPNALSQRLADGIRGAVVDVVPHSRHLACVDATDAYASIVSAFLAKSGDATWNS